MVLINAIILYINGDIELNKVNLNDVINDYELYCPISKYQLSIGVIPIDELEYKDRQINNIATNIYTGEILGDCIIISDDEDEIPIYYEELKKQYKI
jgi:hypothetical protein